MSRMVALITSIAFFGTVAGAGPEDQLQALKTYITTQFQSNEASQAMAKSLISQYVAKPATSQGVVSAASDTISVVNANQVILSNQIHNLTNSLDRDLGSQVAQNPYMQENLRNLLGEMRTTVQQNAELRQDAVHNGRFGVVYWTIVISTLAFSYHIAGKIEATGHPFYGVLTMATMLLGTAAIASIGLGKVWKRPSERNPRPEINSWDANLVEITKQSQLKWCNFSLSH